MARNSMEILLIISEKAMGNIIRQMDKYLKEIIKKEKSMERGL